MLYTSNLNTCIMNTCGGSAFSVYHRGGMEPPSAMNYSCPSMMMNSSSGYGHQFREQSHDIPTYHASSLFMKLQEDGSYKNMSPFLPSLSSTYVHCSYETSTVCSQPHVVQYSYHRHVSSPPNSNSIERLPPIQSLLNNLKNDIPYLLPTIKETFHNDFQHANSYSSPSPMQNNNIMYGYASPHSDASNSSNNAIWIQNEITSSSPVHSNSPLSNRLLHSPNNSDQKTAATAPTQSKRREKIEMSSLISKQDCRIKKQSKKKEDSSNLGQWTAEEHKQFLLGLSQVGENYKLIGKLYVKTRSRRQIVNHAHKYLKRRSAK